ncbi:MAG: 3-hydroxyacyl-CoA dehydrogenase [Chitinophagales bacterium]|nr:3-hydroxyacyl-CoA dehydrogenase [Chitinophagaceae bacterium]MCB9065287.1 3-hydroxyacyl-CoA dehydrogenase [Chitinophagales bacterium]
MNRAIRKVAVVGSGVMGSRIAAHFAGIGVEVLLLDIIPRELTEAEKAKGITEETPAWRNKIVNDALNAMLKSKPSAVYHSGVAKLITTGNIEDDLHEISECDWVLEAVIERLDIKQQVFEKIEQHRKPGTLITTNTSGIPIHMMSEGRSEDFRKHFCGTHFFNPPRYLRLLEIIPAPDTKQEIIDFLMEYGDRHLGKTMVLCKDTPAFIANRVGVFGFMAVFHAMQELGLSIDETDSLTGTIMGRPKSATFRTGDVVGLDTLVHVAKALPQNVPNDEAKDIFKIPAFIEKMIENKWLGDKTGQGFYKKTKDDKGKTEILTLNPETMDYTPKQKVRFATIETAKPLDELQMRLKALYAGQDKAGEFYRMFHHMLFAYASNRIPEIADELYKIDDALKAGFGWEIGAFESWDTLGVKKVIEAMKAAGNEPAKWVTDMLEAGNNTFYITENGERKYYDIESKSYKVLPAAKSFIILEHLNDKVVWENSACKLYDIGDDVVALRWNTKMNSIGGEVLAGVQKAVSIAEERYKGLVLANAGPNFSAGANVGLIFMFAVEQEYDELDMAIRQFQNTTMRLRHSNVPVVMAPHGLTLGGACEMCLHADAVQASAESYIGLVELGVGLIPSGGGTKEMVVRASDRNIKEDIELNYLQQLFINIGTAKVGTSAHEAYELSYMRKGYDGISINPDRRIGDAKQRVLQMYEQGYTQPVMRHNIKVQGKSGLGPLMAGIHGMWRGNYISDYDRLIAEKLAHVMCGGDLSHPTLVSEHYLLDLEREAFLSLCGQKKTLERLQSILQTGKPLRN